MKEVSVPMADYIAAYHTYLVEEKHAQANTLSSYMRDINQYNTWLLERGGDLRKVKKESIAEYFEYLSSKGKSPATITRSTASVKSFYNFMVSSGAMKTNPAKTLTGVKVER